MNETEEILHNALKIRYIEGVRSIAIRVGCPAWIVDILIKEHGKAKTLEIIGKTLEEIDKEK